ncbi:MAG: COX aromatic rich motif-containing protein [Parachlamydia sp.]|jgi:cytochrome o ubiquinol oxidase subunit 2|nr:COX aromatic rich motif-containing protein [Parachlamydia sp.]
MLKKIFIGLFAILLGIIGCALVLSSEDALLVHPKGIISRGIYDVFTTNILLMLAIIVPTYIFLFIVVWKYCLHKNVEEYEPNHTVGLRGQLVLWGLPTIIVALLSYVTWVSTHQLNPYKPLESEEKTLMIQVVALNWKWLFIYPEQGIATLNHFYIPEKTPIHFRLTADGAPMNSFWIPQLSGQIYSMAGMNTQLHIMADGPGEFAGREAEINGEGYADMTFLVKSTSKEDFQKWIEAAKHSPLHLSKEAYEELVKPYIDKSFKQYTEVPKDFYHEIVHKYMFPPLPVL